MLRIAFFLSLLCGVSANAWAGPLTSDSFTGGYSVSDTYNGAGSPLVSDAVPASFSGTLTLNSVVGPDTLVVVSPTSGSGLVTGSLIFDFSFSDGSAVTGVSSTAGANQASLSNGQVQIAANYAINYATQTDCIAWNGSCTPAGSGGSVTQPLGDTLAVRFASGAVLDIGLYNWADWDMEPGISFDLVTAPTAVPEPGALALLAAGIWGVAAVRRRRRAVW